MAFPLPNKVSTPHLLDEVEQPAVSDPHIPAQYQKTVRVSGVGLSRFAPPLLKQCNDPRVSAQLYRSISQQHTEVRTPLIADETSAAPEVADRFFDLSIDMLCFLDFRGHFKRLNPAWERTLGFSTDELLSKPFIEFVHPDDRERTINQNKEVRRGGKALLFENRYRCKDGSYRWLLWNATADLGHETIYSVARDITVHKQIEAEREILVRELQAALAEVRTLQAILPICSHCRKIRDDERYWHTVEGYISRFTNTQFSHSICPTCYEREYEPLLGPLAD